MDNLDETGITTSKYGMTIKFEFIEPPRNSKLNSLKKELSRKEDYVMSLKEEVNYKSIDTKLQDKNLQNKIEEFINTTRSLCRITKCFLRKKETYNNSSL